MIHGSGPTGRDALRLLEMAGSYLLSDEGIDEALTQTSPGNYALGYMDGDAFTVFYVGRSDSDVRQRLHDWVGMPSRYEAYTSSAKAPWGTSMADASCPWAGRRPVAWGTPRAATRASRTATRARPRPPTPRSGATTTPSAAADSLDNETQPTS